MNSLKVAIVCDWLMGTGGAERVVLELHKMFPDAPIYTSQYNPNPKIWHGGEWFKDANIQTGWLQKLPKSLKKFLPVFRAWYFSHLNLKDFDLVISSSGAEAKFVKVKPESTHIIYCHAPTHYYWARYDDYLKNPGFGKLNFLARLGLRLLVWPMRRWDYKAAQRPDFFVANSGFTRDQIKKYYDRSAEVIHPPVDVGRFSGQADEARQGFVAAGRQTPYKRIDLAVAACTKLDLPLVVLGSGPDYKKLKKLAGKTITFLRDKNDEEVAHYFKSSLAFIFPGVDDFGIVAVEAMAAGTPVIAYKAGGALDYVNDKTGMFFDQQSIESLADTLQKFNPTKFDDEVIAKQAQNFSTQNFQNNFAAFLKGLK